MFQSFQTTGIGSLPHTDPGEACRVVLDSVDIPFWPQLPHRSFHELMVPQYSEGFPFVRISGDSIHADQAGGDALSLFYESIAAKRGFPISREYAAGFYAFIEILKEKDSRFAVIKGHVTGPLTFSLSLTDRDKRPVYFDEEMRELSLELLKGKVSWQVDALRPFADRVMIFVDEPVLTALGSSTYLGVSSEEALRMLREVVGHIKACGGIAGIHCCGKADWPLVLSAGIDVLNFDTYDFGDSLSIYPGEITQYIEQGGAIAWGIVPTTEAIRTVDLADLTRRLDNALASLGKAGVPEDRLRRQSLLTPSCGTGSLLVPEALKVFSLLRELRNTYAGS
ncbi:MAG: hypothetical protein JSU90_07355 [Nitrospiraceae bacterium]|nr:MAG: hypothetical protein JSU90_07355 [Nitrospiraceae bacterium]